MNRLQKWFAKRLLGFDVKALGDQKYTIQNGRLVSLNDSQLNYITKGYNINDIIFSVVNIQLDKVRMAPWTVYKVVDESSLKRSRILQSRKMLTPKEYQELLGLQSKALEAVANPGKWGELLKYPNECESFNDFVAKGCGFKLLTGNKYIWADVLQGGAEKGTPHRLYNMPSQHVQIEASDGFPGRVTGYVMNAITMATKTKYEIEEIMHEKYANYEYSTAGEQHYGMAPLRAALKLLNRNNSALDASTAKFQNGGLDAVVYVNHEGLSGDQAVEQANALKAKLIQEYTGPINQGKIATSGYPVGVANLGLSPVELNIIESEKWDLVRFAAIYGVPPELVGFTGTKTYDNIKTAEKALTNRCALPLLTSFRDSLNRKASTDWKLPKGQIIDFDMTVFPELDEDMGEKAKWVTTLKGLSPNEQRSLLNLDLVDNPLFDEPWITPEMGTPLSEWSVNEVDRTLNEDGEDDV